jgi:DUF4097 and DUF4098 domain-containing protein YvlB
MKIITIATMLVAAVALPCYSFGLTGPGRTVSISQDDLAERDEINQNFQLSPGVRVSVSGINGPVDIVTSHSQNAEVHIVRSADNRDDLAHHRIIVEQISGGLSVHGENDHSRARVRQRVLLNLPRQVDLDVSGVNGRVKVGELDGPARVHGINGRVEVGQATGFCDVSGINGAIVMTLAQLGDRGLHMSGINGGIELRFAPDVNADLEVSSINGAVYTEMPNVTMQGKWGPNNFRAKIGGGGAPISISGVNGRIKMQLRTQ